MMENPDRAQIIKRAYELWEQAGSPEGRAEEFYHQAEQELQNETESESESDPLRTARSSYHPSPTQRHLKRTASAPITRSMRGAVAKTVGLSQSLESLGV